VARTVENVAVNVGAPSLLCSIKQKYDEVEDGVKRTVRETNRKYDVKGKASAAFSR
jgi:hypothetical protein